MAAGFGGQQRLLAGMLLAVGWMAGGRMMAGGSHTRVRAAAPALSLHGCSLGTSRNLAIRLRGGTEIPRYGWDQTAGEVQIFVFDDESKENKTSERKLSADDFSFQARTTGFSLVCSRWDLTISELFFEIDASRATFKIKDKYILIRLPKADIDVLWPKLQKVSKLVLEDIPTFPASWHDDADGADGLEGENSTEPDPTEDNRQDKRDKSFQDLESSSKVKTMMIERQALERLLVAAKENRLAELEKALEHECKARSEPPNVILDAFKDANARGVVHWAAAEGHVEVIKLAMRAGADMKARDENGQSPFFIAVVNKRMEAARLVARNVSVDVNEKDAGLRATPLHHAAGNGDLQMIHMLMLMNANVNATSILGSALQWAAMSECEEAVKLLITLGADPNVLPSDEGGRKVPPPLVMAASMNQHRMCELYVGAGANLSLCDQEGFTALHFAAETGNVDLFRLLVERGCDVAAKNVHGKTPLQLARYRWRKSQRYQNMRDILISLGRNLSDSELCGDSDEEEEDEDSSEPEPAPTMSSTGNSGTAVVFKEKGNEALRSNKMEEAYAFYTEAILLDPSRKEFFSNRCAALLALQRHEEALADAQTAKAMDSSWAKACFREGQVS
ncbi:hypothetical protein GUITHDRAFT_143837 [Guillardia theta CCMP2712]|uniref:CS domain-containing protein n=1 Tax=Guillardia theta (strain CCMP2712) TaxID=905079 RepID=L1IT07_GUITC|nr:hypothetical protein GUITHDRAFT_143837 [Guillardia theta CCMP2712]EKX39034.1 hypothetical protein GUITHDRAFT_143837 [Guillardia theta CCMP2712]|eukprot:XP_005826014.1 hypothetical protein GUITHDRAFT_143837 [Guillardia theta CCMP2712]